MSWNYSGPQPYASNPPQTDPSSSSDFGSGQPAEDPFSEFDSYLGNSQPQYSSTQFGSTPGDMGGYSQPQFNGGYSQQQQQQPEQPSSNAFSSFVSNPFGTMGQAALSGLFSSPSQGSSEAFIRGATNTIGTQQQKVKKYLNSDKFRYYFAVSNGYVFNKLKILTFPFMKKDWVRHRVRVDSSGNSMYYDPTGSSNTSVIYHPPREDVNAPDLYIPVVGLFTYVILVCALYSIHDLYTPLVLTKTTTTIFATLAFDILLTYAVLYLFSNSARLPFMELLCWSGYIFVPLCIGRVFSLVRLSIVGYIVMAYGIACLCYFIFQTAITSMRGDSIVNTEQSKTQNVAAIIIAALKIPVALLILFFTTPRVKAS
ncbi:putative Protein transport protein yif1 [Blattamonas nauphoetae]|uniref:Protein YIF1 n=1 Tax=Blattamonas nauphoetae TaxID=2049346 RepID=A0ABQ9YMM0_9EUKA|nr:putative Protein transport protein yif1 [Blattamonas nauphoetae]